MREREEEIRWYHCRHMRVRVLDTNLESGWSVVGFLFPLFPTNMNECGNNSIGLKGTPFLQKKYFYVSNVFSLLIATLLTYMNTEH